MSSVTRADLLEREIIKLMNDEIDRLSFELSLGNVENFEAYARCAGKIAGLRQSLVIVEEAISEVNKRYS